MLLSLLKKETKISMEEILISNNQYPPGIRFHPSDVELISYYLDRRVKDLPLPPNVVTDIDLYSYNPWDLPRKSVCGEDDEWYFFTPRNRKYPNGGRPNRAAASGYWKATATDQPIFQASTKMIGVKKGLVFYQGKPPNGHRTDWTMTEYRLPDTSRPSRPTTGSMRLDDWVLCRIRHKGNMSKNENVKEPPSVSCGHDCRDMLSDYLQSNEYNVIVSLLAGRHHPTIHQSSRPAIRADHGSDKINTQHNFHHSESSQSKVHMISYGDIQLPSNMIINEQSGSFVATDKCKPRYPSNAFISFQEL